MSFGQYSSSAHLAASAQISYSHFTAWMFYCWLVDIFIIPPLLLLPVFLSDFPLVLPFNCYPHWYCCGLNAEIKSNLIRLICGNYKEWGGKGKRKVELLKILLTITWSKYLLYKFIKLIFLDPFGTSLIFICLHKSSPIYAPMTLHFHSIYLDLFCTCSTMKHSHSIRKVPRVWEACYTRTFSDCHMLASSSHKNHVVSKELSLLLGSRGIHKDILAPARVFPFCFKAA